MTKNYRAWPDQWPRHLNYIEQPVFSFLDDTAARAPNRLAIIFGGMELTFAELHNLANRFANALKSLGVKRGDKVAIHLPNCPQFAIAYYGVLKAGATFTPMSPLLAPREALFQLNDSETRFLISLDLIYPGLAPLIPDTSVEKVITTSIADCYNSIIQPLKPLEKIPVPETLDMSDLLKEHSEEALGADIDPRSDLAHLAYTGGTTGSPKGVMLTHYNVVVNTIQYAHWWTGAQIETQNGVPVRVFPEGVDPVKDRITAPDQETALVVVPWFHAMGTVGYLNQMVYSGNTMVVFPRFDAVEYLGAIKKYKATVLGGAPQLYIPLVNASDFDTYDLSGIKIAASGAAPLAMPVLDKMLKAFSGVVCEGYGMTECSMGATMNPPDRSRIRHGSVGIPVFDTECKAVDLATGEDLPPGVEGEICIKGPQVMKGYWKKPDETAAVLKDGWLHTGDIGKIDDDGYLYITDRKKDMIIYKGYNVYPRELEEIIFAHPAVEQCAVVGRADMQAGEVPVAFVQCLKGATVSEQEILEHVNNQVAAYKKIRGIKFVEAMPVSPAGKVLKRELREMLKPDPVLIAPCGLYCGVCAIYMAHRDDNLKFKDRLASLYRGGVAGKGKLPNSENLTAQDIKCRGCLSEERFMHCHQCEIRDCTQEKGYAGCHQCDEFPCQHIENFPMTVGKRVILRAVPYWREKGTERWIQDEEARYVCPECGNRVFRGVVKCNRCRAELDLD